MKENQQRPTEAVGTVPTRLVERPKARLAWCGGFTVLGIAVIVVGVLSARPSDGPWMRIGLFALGVGMIALGTVALRWSIVADREGVTVTNGRRRTIAWAELEDVQLVKVESDLDLGFHHLLLLTHTGDAIRPAAPTGWNRPGRRLPRLRDDLLAMRDYFTSGAPAGVVGTPDGET